MNQYGILSYLSRSGSTFLSDKLNRFKDICVTLEASFAPEFLGILSYRLVVAEDIKHLRRLISDLESMSKIKNWKLDRELIIQRLMGQEFPIDGIQVFKTYLDCFKETYKPDAKIVIYKGSPVMPWTIPQVLNNLSQFKVVYLQRDPRAVYASQSRNKLPYTNTHFANSPFDVGLDWKNSYKATESYDNDNFFKVKYEDLIGNEQRLNDVALFFGASDKLDESSFKYSQILPQEEKSIHLDATKSSKVHYIDKWQHQISEDEISMIDWLCGDLLVKENYKSSSDFDSLKIAAKFKRYKIQQRGEFLLKKLKKIVNSPSLYLRRLKLRK